MMMRKDAIIPGRSAEFFSFPTSVRQSVTRVIGGNIMEYWDKDADEGHGDNRRVKGNEIGPFIVPVDQIVTAIPKGTLVTLDTDPTPLPTTPLTERKWIRFRNEDLIDIELCDENGDVFRTLEPGEESPTYAANEDILFYGKVATGTADTGVRVEEGK